MKIKLHVCSFFEKKIDYNTGIIQERLLETNTLVLKSALLHLMLLMLLSLNLLYSKLNTLSQHS